MITESSGDGMRWIEYGLFLSVVLVLVRPLGNYLARVFQGERTFLDPVLLPVERLLHQLLGVRPEREMNAGIYATSFIVFGLLGTGWLFLLLVIQETLPGGPADRFLTTPMTPDLGANTAISFASTTTWQAYSGENSLRYFTQLLGLVAQNFLGGAASLAVGIAFLRGFSREHSATIGNFWVDLIRALLWVLLPLSFVGGLLLVWEGVPLNLSRYTEVHTLEGGEQVIAQGPVASLEWIKNLGSNGGGFFAANGAHPYANPTPLTNFLTLLAIICLPASLPVTFGRMTNRPSAGRVLFGVMLTLFVTSLVLCDLAENAPSPTFANRNITGGNLEGKEVRFGVGGSVLAAVVTASGATGSNNSMHDSFQPLAVLVLLGNLLLGEVAFGGLGTGLLSLIMVALVGTFVAGLMVGRTPEYLGKTIGIAEAKRIALYALVMPVVVIPLTGWAVVSEMGRAGLTTNEGPRTFTEALFAYASCLANNGQALAGLNANTPFWNLTTSVAMLAGRYGLICLALSLAGRLAAQGRRKVTVGTLPDDTLTYGVLVLGTVLLVGAVCFFPALALGPLAEHFRP